MANMLDYLDWRGDLTIDRDGFNDVDNVILASLSSLNMDVSTGITIGVGAMKLLDKGGIKDDYIPFLQKLGTCARFKDVKILDFENLFDAQEEMQFAAYTFDTMDGHAFIAFRGTDNTIVGWKEDFNMAFMQSVPAQRESVRYLKGIAARYDMPLRVGGHSKGGNLAVYASSQCGSEIQKRIVQIFNNDGPGLNEDIMDSDEYKAISDKVRTFLPQSSMVGILLYHTEDYRVVSSTAIGPLQHKPSSWQVMGREFVFEGELRKGSQYMDKTLKKWLEGMSVDERREMIDALYDIMTAANIKTFKDLTTNWRASGSALYQAYKELSPDSRQILRKVLGELVSAGVENARGGDEE